MSYRSSTSSSRRALLLGLLLLGAAWLAVSLSALPPVAFYGGLRLAQKAVALRVLERSGPVEAFVIGPSHVDQGFDAERFGAVTGLRAFNLGVQGTDMYLQSLLVRRLLDEGRRPRAVLWAVRDETLSRSNINRQYLEAPALRGLGAPLGGLGLEAGFWLPQFQRRGLAEWIDTLRHGEPEPLDAHGRLLLAGPTRQERRRALHERRGEAAGGATGTGEEGAPDEDDEPDEDRAGFLGSDYAVELEPARAHIAATLERLRALGIEVWLFLTPYNQAVFGRGTGYARGLLTGHGAEYYRWLEQLAADHGATLLDLRYCAEISPRPELFFDSRHLNGRGAGPLGQLVGELFAGQRPIPEAWRGAPARAQFEAVLGPIDAARVPRLAADTRHGLGAALLERQGARVVSLVVEVLIERPGRYRAVLLDDAPRPHRGSFFTRLGAGPYQLLEGGPGAGAARVVIEAELPSGPQRLELHARPGADIDWDAWAVLPAQP